MVSVIAVLFLVYSCATAWKVNGSDMPSVQVKKLIKISSIFLASALAQSQIALARPEGVNRPDLLPKDLVPVIDVANFLSRGQEKKAISSINELEKQTGYRLRLLCQSYPNTPGLAIKDYWKIDDNVSTFQSKLIGPSAEP